MGKKKGECLYPYGVEISHRGITIRVQGTINAVSLHNPNEDPDYTDVDYLGDVAPDWCGAFNDEEHYVGIEGPIEEEHGQD